MRPNQTPTAVSQKRRIVEKLGGVKIVAEILSLDPSTVSGWRDFIPSKHHSILLASERARAAGLCPEDFFEPAPTSTEEQEAAL